MLQPQDLLAPQGRIEGGSFFPELSSAALDSRIQSYIDQGYVAATENEVAAEDRDAAVRHYVNWRALDAVLLRLNTNPISATTSEAGGSSSAAFSQRQLDNLAQEAVNERESWESYWPSETDAPVRAPSTTTFVANTFNF